MEESFQALDLIALKGGITLIQNIHQGNSLYYKHGKHS